MKRVIAFLFAAAHLIGSVAANAEARAPTLQARPGAHGLGLNGGETRLAFNAVVYRPPAAPGGPLPLIVLLHGAGGYPPRFLQKMEPEADRRGAILLAPRSLGVTWDMVEDLRAGDYSWRGPDARRLDDVLADLFARTEVDPSRVILLGFSDGASYALSLGVANPKLFTAVVALSPGMFVSPRRFDRAQRVFIAHGRGDSILPFSATNNIVDQLRAARVTLRFHPFQGGHEIDRRALTEALDWTLSAPDRRFDESAQ